MTVAERAAGDESTLEISAADPGRGPNRAASAAPAATGEPTTTNLTAAKPLVLSAYPRAEPTDRCGPSIGRADAKPLAVVAQAPAPITAIHVAANTHLAGEYLATRKVGTAVPASKTGRPTTSGAQR